MANGLDQMEAQYITTQECTSIFQLKIKNMPVPIGAGTALGKKSATNLITVAKLLDVLAFKWLNCQTIQHHAHSSTTMPAEIPAVLKTVREILYLN